ncbi:collagen binding domain-containing protein [Levilactobacillus parabrevis]|uniref:MSCRAMM family protein n=1 Tax=Levilactobacillus parabrevis TaxID=357278 RepID=UPI00375719C9
MKKWLRIILLITCFVGLTSFLRTQAQEREASISTATLQDKTGGVVTEITSHQPQDLQLELAMEIPEGETVVTLDNEDNAKFKPGKITDLDPDKDITAEVDEDHQLLLNNEQESAQKVKLIVPIKLADPLLIPTLLLKIKLGDTPVDVEGIHEIEVKAEDSDADNEATEETVVENQDKDTSTKKKDSQKTKQKKSQKTVTPNNDNNATKKVAEKTTTQEDTKATEEVTNTNDAKKSSLSKTTLSTPTEDPEKRLTGDDIKVHQGRVQIGSWSEKMDIGGSLIGQEGVEVVDKTSGEDGTNVGKFYVGDNFRKYYYVSYQQKNNALSHAVALPGNPDLNNKAIVVYYPEVGAYTDSNQAEKPDKKMGAIVKISNMKYRDKNKEPKRLQEPFIDFSSNFYSGIVYNGIEELDIDVTFTNEDGTQALIFPGKIDDKEFNAYFTFGSLNGNEDKEHEWAGTRLPGLKGKLSEKSLVKERDNGWYEGVGKGIWEVGVSYTADNEWGDFLGSTNYEKGAVSFPMIGTTQEFKLRSESGFTWQSFSTGTIVPLRPEEPSKTVHPTDDFGLEFNDLDGATINRDENDLSSFYYTVYQPTYGIPDEAIAKPNNIIMTDRLPDGATLNPEAITLYNTDGEPIKVDAKDRGALGIDGQNITYTLSDKEIEMLDFNGDPFAFQMRVTFDDDFVGTFRNRAKVAFNSGGKYDFENETNEVVTHFHKGLTLKKLGDLPWDPAKMKELDGVVFNVTSSDGESTKFKTGSNGELVLRKLDAKKTYTITEEVPKGYVSPQEFTLTYSQDSKRWEISGNSDQVVISGGQNDQVITVTNKVKRGDYQFQKIDGSTDKALAGAEFIIRNKAGKYLTFNSDGKMTGVVDTHQEATRLTSTTNAPIKVTGLPYGKYKLIEAKAPDGYVVGTTHKFTVSKKMQGKTELIKNDPYSLPVTGGRGIIWFISLGLILTLLALAIWRTHPRGG